MQVKILKEAGYEEALLGLSLSFYDHKVPLSDFWTTERFEKAKKITLHLATKQPPDDYEVRNNLAYISAEQKFLEQIDIWIYVQASRDFWSEFDTYRVDMSKQSSSTMHTLDKRTTELEDYEVGTSHLLIDAFNTCLGNHKTPDSRFYKDISRLKKNLPEGWLQERVIKTSYKTLKWILEQREGHRLASWKFFYEEVLKQLEHPEFIKLEQASKTELDESEKKALLRGLELLPALDGFACTAKDSQEIQDLITVVTKLAKRQGIKLNLVKFEEN